MKEIKARKESHFRASGHVSGWRSFCNFESTFSHPPVCVDKRRPFFLQYSTNISANNENSAPGLMLTVRTAPSFGSNSSQIQLTPSNAKPFSQQNDQTTPSRSTYLIYIELLLHSLVDNYSQVCFLLDMLCLS